MTDDTARIVATVAEIEWLDREVKALQSVIRWVDGEHHTLRDFHHSCTDPVIIAAVRRALGGDE